MTFKTLGNIGRNRDRGPTKLIFKAKIAAFDKRLINMDG
jgi:hypothetical protein